MKTLNDIYSSWTGIFSNMTEPLWSSMFSSTELDLQFFGEQGQKNISPYLEHFLDEDGELSENNKTIIANYLYNRFKTQWQHKYNILLAEYNPIENYRMTEQGEDSILGEKTTTYEGQEKTQIDYKGQETNTDDYSGTEQETNVRTGSITTPDSDANNIYGFGGSQAQPSSTSSGTSTETYNNLTDTKTKNLTNRQDTHTKGFTNRSDEQTKSFTGRQDSQTDDTTNTHELTRSGNIGVTTSQQMIQSEIELWNWNFISDVFRDIASVLTLSVY